MNINHHPDDQIPVYFEDRPVGRVTKVRTYTIDDQGRSEVTVEIDDSNKRLMAAILDHGYLTSSCPILRIFFPRTIHDIDIIFRVGQ